MVSARSSKNWVRLLGIALLAFLLYRVDIGRLGRVLVSVHPGSLALAVLLNLPQICLKTYRWRRLLYHTQGIHYDQGKAILSYFGSIFIGLLTPGRLGEFVKAVHVCQDCGVSLAQAFSSVLADRLFDLYALLLVGGAAMLTLTEGNTEVLALIVLALLFTLPLVLFLSDTTFGWLQLAGLRLGHRLFATGSWLQEMRLGLRQLTRLRLLATMGLTVLAHVTFFCQCYLLALALGLRVGFVQVSFAVALGSLVTLLPVSISGLGTREAAIVAYLGTAEVPAEMALGFSLLVFVTFYVTGGLMGAVAWWLKPVPLAPRRRENAT